MPGPELEPRLHLGLRFTRRSIPRLRELAEQYEGQPNIDTMLYRQATEAAELDEPLEVFCSDRDEIEQMAGLFVVLGVERPTIDELNG